jgi:hypothetical protein
VADELALDIHKQLPPSNYIVKKDSMGNLYLEETDRFKPISKYYGDCLKNSDRIHRTFADRPNSTGVMLTGEKGSGKTLLAKELCIKGYELGIPTIVINSDWTGDVFNKFLQDIDQPCIILFDEFEKVYDHRAQEYILTLLDGVFPSKKLFVLTCNDKWRIDKHMRNRPGRIFYMMDFTGLTTEFIVEYCNDNLNEKKWIDKICKIATLFTEFNFDMLQAVVRELNRFGGTIEDLVEILNVKPHNAGKSRWKARLVCPEHPDLKITSDPLEMNPIKLFQSRSNDTYVMYMHVDGKFTDGREVRYNSVSANLKMENLRSVDPVNMTYTFNFNVEVTVEGGDGKDDDDINLNVKLIYFEDRPMSMYAGAWNVSDAF